MWQTISGKGGQRKNTLNNFWKTLAVVDNEACMERRCENCRNKLVQFDCNADDNDAVLWYEWTMSCVLILWVTKRNKSDEEAVKAQYVARIEAAISEWERIFFVSMSTQFVTSSSLTDTLRKIWQKVRPSFILTSVKIMHVIMLISPNVTLHTGVTAGTVLSFATVRFILLWRNSYLSAFKTSDKFSFKTTIQRFVSFIFFWWSYYPIP